MCACARSSVWLIEKWSSFIRGETGYTHSLSPSRPPNNTLNTQSRAQQTHSRLRSLRALESTLLPRSRNHGRSHTHLSNY
eukprot:scaffold72139_cov74-Phaeocystis_antarctica.AAC.1